MKEWCIGLSKYHTETHTYDFTYHTYTHTHIQCAYTHTHTDTHTDIHTHRHTHTHTYTHIHTYTHTHTHIHTYTYTHIHTYTHTRIRLPSEEIGARHNKGDANKSSKHPVSILPKKYEFELIERHLLTLLPLRKLLISVIVMQTVNFKGGC